MSSTRRHLEFVLGWFFPLMIVGGLLLLLFEHQETAQLGNLERMADQNFLAFRFHADPVPSLRKWGDSLFSAAATGGFLASQSTLPPIPPHLPLQVVVYSPEGIPWAHPKGRLQKKFIFERLWPDIEAGVAPPNNFSMYRGLVGRGLGPLLLFKSQESGRIQSFINPGGSRSYVYWRRGPAKSGVFAFSTGFGNVWENAFQACSQLKDRAAWVLRNPHTGQLTMIGALPGHPSDGDIRWAPWPTRGTRDNQWYFRQEKTLQGIEVLQILTCDQTRYFAARWVTWGSLVFGLTLGFWNWKNGKPSPLSGMGIIQRFLVLLIFAVLLPGGIFGFLWVDWFQGRLDSMAAGIEAEALSRVHGVDEKYRDWLAGVPRWYKRIMNSPALLEGNPAKVENLRKKLWKAGWPVAFVQQDVAHRILAMSFREESLEKFYGCLCDILLKHRMGIPIPQDDLLITQIIRSFQSSPEYGYPEIVRFSDRLFPLDFLGNYCLTLWQVRTPTPGRPVAVTYMGQEIRTLGRYFIRHSLPPGVFAYFSEEGGWQPAPPPFPVDVSLLAEASIALRPISERAWIGNDFRLVTCAPSAALQGVAYVTASSLAAIGETERRLWNILLISGLAALGVILTISRMLSQALLRPLAEVSHGITALDQGDVSYRIPNLGQDEFGQLARTFNDMMAERADLDVAAEVQRHILPREVPAVTGYRTAYRNIPLAEVGGDYLDIQKYADGRLLLTIADVTGHGLSAALITMMAKTFISLEVQRNATLVDLLDLLNRQIFQLVRRKKYFTFAAALVDPVNHRVEWTSAGHPSPFLLTPDGEWKELKLKVIQNPVGISPKKTWQSAWLDLLPGQSILFYTDGLIETSNPQEELFGYDRLQDFLKSRGDRDPETLLDELLAFRATFAEEVPLEDDLTLLMVQRTPVSS